MSDLTIEETIRSAIAELAGLASVSWDDNAIFMPEPIIAELDKVVARVESALREAYDHGQQDTISKAMAIVQQELDDPDNHWPMETTLERIRDEIEMLTNED